MSAGLVPAPHIIALKVVDNPTSKNYIDIDTDVEIRSEDQEADVYYTLDGSAPEPFTTAAGQRNNTRKYRWPIKLKSGKITVKALAVSKDGLRQSRVVTKAFVVGGDNNTARSVNSSHGLSRSAGPTPKAARKTYANNWAQLLPNGTVAGDLNTTDVLNAVEKQLKLLVAQSKPKQGAASNEILASALICPKCCAPRNNDTDKFCSECGGLFPNVAIKQAATLPPHALQMGTCSECKNYVPLDADICPECRAPILDQLLPTPSLALYRLECKLCKALNPPNRRSCMNCEGSLEKALRVNSFAKPPISLAAAATSQTAAVRCMNCKTTNESSAAFCRNCGNQLPKINHDACAQCGQALTAKTKFCPACGALIPASDSAIVSAVKSEPIVGKTTTKHGISAGMGAKFSGTSLVKNEKSTQTLDTSKTGAVLSLVSPGNGYWRQQLDHMNAHLRRYSEISDEFRDTMSQARIGKIVDAVADIEDGKLSIWLDFEIVGEKEMPEPVQPRYKDAAAAMAKRRHTTDNIQNRSPTTRSKSQPTTAKKKPPVKPKQAPKLTKQDEGLHTELSSSEKDADEVERLLTDGADPNSCDLQGHRAIEVAVKNFFPDAVKLLAKHGADLNKTYVNNGGTALHDAVLLGPPAKTVIQALLSAGIDANIKNKAGKTAQDLAIAHSYNEIADLIAAHISQQLLQTTL